MNLDYDISYYLSVKQSELDTIAAGMAALISESDGKYEAMKNQNWFNRMVKTVIGKNKATVEDIRRNNEQLTAYCAKALAVFLEQKRISDGIVNSLGLQINALYASHLELKGLLHGIGSKLNEKIEAVDNYFMLSEDIALGKFGNHRTDIFRILARVDRLTAKDLQKISNIKEMLRKHNVIDDSRIRLGQYLLDVCETPDDYVGTVYMETLVSSGSLIAELTAAILEKWNMLTDANRQFVTKQDIIDRLLASTEIKGDTEFSLFDQFVEMLESKCKFIIQVPQIPEGPDIEITPAKPPCIEKAKEKGIEDKTDKKVSVIEKQLIETFKPVSFTDLHCGDIPSEVRENALRKINIQSGEKIAGIVSAMVAGKSGAVFTTDGIYIYSTLISVIFVPYSKIKRASGGGTWVSSFRAGFIKYPQRRGCCCRRGKG